MARQYLDTHILIVNVSSTILKHLLFKKTTGAFVQLGGVGGEGL